MAIGGLAGFVGCLYLLSTIQEAHWDEIAQAVVEFRFQETKVKGLKSDVELVDDGIEFLEKEISKRIPKDSKSKESKEDDISKLDTIRGTLEEQKEKLDKILELQKNVSEDTLRASMRLKYLLIDKHMIFRTRVIAISIGSSLSVIISLFGFYFWYYRVQKPEDEKLKRGL